MHMMRPPRVPLAASILVAAIGCTPVAAPVGGSTAGDGPIANGITARLGEPIPAATPDQLATFARGKDVLLKRFDLSDGLGPTLNVTFCGACHERPTAGGSSGLYRNFVLAGRRTDDGAFLFSESNGEAGGVLRVFHYGTDAPARPAVPETTTIFAQRNAIPFFGVGLIAELEAETILANSDPDDLNGDGISGRPNFDRGFVGRFGRKAQTVSIEGFIRGPLFNHMGITTDPLTDDQRARLPVDSTRLGNLKSTSPVSARKLDPHMQAAAPDVSNQDDDAALDPEMTSEDLFDLVSFAMLLAAPEFDVLTVQADRGRVLFHQANCSACHVPRLQGPRGPIAPYSDLLLHDMGEVLADGIEMKLATGSEFRTQPLWGIAATGPYLHDGRAETIQQAILLHGGEARSSRDAFAAFDEAEQADLVEFLMSLGGRDQHSAGLLEPEADVPAVGAYGGPFRALEGQDRERFVRGRALFDRDFGFDSGAGAPRFNGDSCRACHFDPVLGGAGPRGVNVMRHGIINDAGSFTAPIAGTILHKQTAALDASVLPEQGVNVFEQRQTPHLFGLGLVDLISEETMAARADPDDGDGDGISGRVSITADGRVGRLGWKAQVPSLAEFVRDAMGAELGLTVEPQPGLTFGTSEDNDGVTDPEFSSAEAEDLAFFMAMLAPPPRQASAAEEASRAGEAIFEAIGCAKCHVASIETAEGTAFLYSDLLLHEILPAGATGIVDTSAGIREFRTAPLWGLSRTAPYLHDGGADTIDEAIRAHDGEAAGIRDAYAALSERNRNDVLTFLNSL